MVAQILDFTAFHHEIISTVYSPKKIIKQFINKGHFFMFYFGYYNFVSISIRLISRRKRQPQQIQKKYFKLSVKKERDRENKTLDDNIFFHITI